MTAHRSQWIKSEKSWGVVLPALNESAATTYQPIFYSQNNICHPTLLYSEQVKLYTMLERSPRKIMLFSQ